MAESAATAASSTSARMRRRIAPPITFENPHLIVPKKSEFKAKSDDFRYTFPANSVTILRWKN